MSQTAYPTAKDLKKFAVASGLMTTDRAALEDAVLDAINQAVRDWEERTGLIPFLLDSADKTVLYDPPGHHGDAPGQGIFGTQRGGGRRLHLPDPAQGGAVFASITSVTIGVGPSSAGTLLTLNQDYVMEPLNAALNSRPYEWILFAGRQWGAWRSVQVVGKRGWPAVPDDVWAAILRRGLRNMGPAIQAGISGGLLSWKEADATAETYGADPLSGVLDRLNAQFEETVGRYRVVTL